LEVAAATCNNAGGSVAIVTVGGTIAIVRLLHARGPHARGHRVVQSPMRPPPGWVLWPP